MNWGQQQPPNIKPSWAEQERALAERAALAVIEWARLEDSRSPQGQALRVFEGRKAQDFYAAICVRCGMLFRRETALRGHLEQQKRHASGLGQPNAGLLVAIACRALCGSPS